MQAVVKEVMKEGEHYGVIPGTEKPTLLKPGAELLNNMYGFFAENEILERMENWESPINDVNFPLFRYVVRTTLRNREGITIATGLGECNSYESRYRWRKSARKCPKCGRESIIKGKDEYGGGFICFQKKGGCGAKFVSNDKQILDQKEGRAPNEQIYDQVNTILKMAKKRSYVDATLSATRTSGIFTQDMEDFAGLNDIKEVPFTVEESGPGKAPEPESRPPKAATAPEASSKEKPAPKGKAKAKAEPAPAPAEDEKLFSSSGELVPEENLIGTLGEDLSAIAQYHDPTALTRWTEINKEKIAQLSAEERVILRKAYKAAMETAKKSEVAA